PGVVRLPDCAIQEENAYGVTYQVFLSFCAQCDLDHFSDKIANQILACCARLLTIRSRMESVSRSYRGLGRYFIDYAQETIGSSLHERRLVSILRASPTESHRQALPAPDVNFSIHPAPIIPPVTPHPTARTGSVDELVLGATRISAACNGVTSAPCVDFAEPPLIIDEAPSPALPR